MLSLHGGKNQLPATAIREPVQAHERVAHNRSAVQMTICQSAIHDLPGIQLLICLASSPDLYFLCLCLGLAGVILIVLVLEIV